MRTRSQRPDSSCFDCLVDSVEQRLFVERFYQHRDRLGPYRMAGRAGIGVAGDENDWNAATGAGQPVVEVKPREPGHSDIQQEAIEVAESSILEEFARGCIRLHSVPTYLEQAGEASSDGEVVVNQTNAQDVHGCVTVRSIGGRVRWNSAPRSLPAAAQMLPPWASTIDRAIARPIPIPDFFVVKKGSNT